MDTCSPPGSKNTAEELWNIKTYYPKEAALALQDDGIAVLSALIPESDDYPEHIGTVWATDIVKHSIGGSFSAWD